MSWKRVLWVLMVLVAFGGVAGCGDDDDGTTAPPVAVDQFEVTRAALDTYITSIATAPTLSAQTVFENLEANYELSTRKPEHYLLGHVPGSKSILYTEVSVAANMATLPKEKLIPVYCYTGHTGGVAATCLGAMGYNAKNMKYGMMAWTSDAGARVVAPFREDDYPGYPNDVETTANTLTATHALPILSNTTSTDHAEVIRTACDKFLSKFRVAGVVPTIEASALHARNFEDGDSSNDYFVLSVRKAEDYAKGHIKGAYNIPWTQIAKAENLRKLPTDKKIVVYCYSGHTGAIAATALGILGYDVLNLKHGMMSWTKDATVRVQAPFTEATDCKEYTFDTGAE